MKKKQPGLLGSLWVGGLVQEIVQEIVREASWIHIEVLLHPQKAFIHRVAAKVRLHNSFTGYLMPGRVGSWV